MNNYKPTFAKIGRMDDPYKLSKCDRWILLLSRPYKEDDDYLFNIDPDTVFYPRRFARQEDSVEILRLGESWKFLRGHEK